MNSTGTLPCIESIAHQAWLQALAMCLNLLNTHSYPKDMFYQDENTAARREKPEKFSIAQKGWRAEWCPNSELGFGYPQQRFLGAMKF